MGKLYELVEMYQDGVESVRQQHYEALNTLRTATNKKVDEANVVYSAALKEVRETFEAAKASAQEAFSQTRREAYAEQEKASEALTADTEKAERKIAEDLLAEVKDDIPVGTAAAFAFMIKDGVWDEYTGECAAVLSELPMTFAELTAYAEERDWCADFDNALGKAVGEGLVEVDGIEFARWRFNRIMGRLSIGQYDQEQVAMAVEDLISASAKQTAEAVPEPEAEVSEASGA